MCIDPWSLITYAQQLLQYPRVVFKNDLLRRFLDPICPLWGGARGFTESRNWEGGATPAAGPASFPIWTQPDWRLTVEKYLTRSREFPGRTTDVLVRAYRIFFQAEVVQYAIT
jgi:hypothetical protein